MHDYKNAVYLCNLHLTLYVESGSGFGRNNYSLSGKFSAWRHFLGMAYVCLVAAGRTVLITKTLYFVNILQCRL